jgi:PAS domain S-box-containing protein
MNKRDLFKAWRELRKNFRGEITEKTVYKIKLGNGQKRLIELVGIPMYEGGKITKVMISGKDITDERKTEKEIKRSEERLFQILQGSNIPMFVIDKNHEVRFWNRACERLTGIRADKIIGTDKQWSAFYKSKRPVMADLIVDRAEEREVLKHYKGTYKKSALIKGAYEAEGFFPGLGKSGKWLSFSAAPLRGSEGNITGAIETLQDITEEKRAEHKLRIKEDRSRMISEITSDYAYGFRVLDRGGLDLEWISGPFKKITGYSQDEISRKGGWQEIVHDEDMIIPVEQLKRLLSGRAMTVEYRITTKQGEIRWIRDYGRPVFDKNKKVVKIVGAVKDVTARKEAENMVKHSEERMRSILSSMMDMVFVLDDKGRFTYYHAPEKAQLFMPPEDFMGKKHSDVLPPGVDKLFSDALDKNKRGQDAQFEYIMKIKGEKRWFSAKTSPIMSGKIFTGSVAVVEDITGKKEAEQEINKRQRELERFNKLAVGRELRMIQLKKRIKELESRLGKKWDDNHKNVYAEQKKGAGI